MIDPDDDEARDLAADDRWRRRHQMELLRHPDCRDPDHPGCAKCLPDDDSNPNESEYEQD